MPKLGNGGYGEKFGYQIDKTDGTVGFEDKSHTYFNLDTGETYISVTQLISEYEQPFDGDFWSSYKALESVIEPDIFSIIKKNLLSTKKFDEKLLKKLKVDEKSFYEKKQEILNEYDTKREESCTWGTSIHLKKELESYKNGGTLAKRVGFTGDFTCLEGDYEINTDHGMYPEILISWVFENGLHVCGQIDCLIIDDNEAVIVDFKTNKEIKKKSYYNSQTKQSVMMKFPVNNFMDTNFYHYQLQLSLYMYLLQQKYPKLQCKKLMLLHIDRDGKETEYPVEYVKDDVERLIAHYVKQQKIKAALHKDDKIFY